MGAYHSRQETIKEGILRKEYKKNEIEKFYVDIDSLIKKARGLTLSVIKENGDMEYIIYTEHLNSPEVIGLLQFSMVGAEREMEKEFTDE